MKSSKRQHYIIRKANFAFQALCDYYYKNQPQILIWMVACMYSGILMALLFGPLFRVSKVLCITNHSPQCPDYVIPELTKYKGILSYFIPLDIIAQKIKSNLPESKEVIILKQWPNILEAHIDWSDPIAQIGIPASTSAYLVAESGKIIGVSDIVDSTIPVVIASSAADLIINQSINDSNIRAAFQAIKLLSGSSNSVIAANVIGPYDIELQLQKGYITYITSMKSVETQVRALQLIISQSTMIQNQHIIDVRLDRPVVKSAP